MIFDIFFLLVIFQVKHLVADYFLQGKYMLQKFKPDWGFFFPLLAHSGVHAGFTLVICLLFAPHLWWLALVDLIIHFVMDRIKAGPKYLGRFKALSAMEFGWAVRDRHTAFLRNDQRIVSEIDKKINGNKYFWWSLGFDQMIHSLTHYYIIFAIVMDTVLTH